MLSFTITRGTEIVFRDETEHGRLGVSLLRTLRLPDDGVRYPLPPGMGPLPVRRVTDLAARVPPHWLARPGVVVPMYRCEAIWLLFSADHPLPHAVKVGCGGINALSGRPLSRRLERPVQPGLWRRAIGAQPTQDYAVCPPQQFIDGFNTGHHSVRQFVAVPLGEGRTVEAQLTGREQHGGIQLCVYPPRRELEAALASSGRLALPGILPVTAGSGAPETETFAWEWDGPGAAAAAMPIGPPDAGFPPAGMHATTIDLTGPAGSPDRAHAATVDLAGSAGLPDAHETMLDLVAPVFPPETAAAAPIDVAGRPAGSLFPTTLRGPGATVLRDQPNMLRDEAANTVRGHAASTGQDRHPVVHSAMPGPGPTPGEPAPARDDRLAFRARGPMLAIVIKERPGEQRRVVFDKPEITIGRAYGNDIVLPSDKVSKRHARIVIKDGKVIIVDLTSTHGTYVNRRKITSPLVVTGADEIVIADFVVSVDEAGPADDDSPRDLAPPQRDARAPRPTEALPPTLSVPPTTTTPDRQAPPAPASAPRRSRAARPWSAAGVVRREPFPMRSPRLRGAELDADDDDDDDDDDHDDAGDDEPTDMIDGPPPAEPVRRPATRSAGGIGPPGGPLLPVPQPMAAPRAAGQRGIPAPAPAPAPAPGPAVERRVVAPYSPAPAAASPDNRDDAAPQRQPGPYGQPPRPDPYGQPAQPSAFGPTARPQAGGYPQTVEPLRGRPEPLAPQASAGVEPARVSGPPTRRAAPVQAIMERPMGLGAGGQISQRIYSDAYGIETWDEAACTELFIHIVSPEAWYALTGEPPPPTPVTFRAYQAAGLPWFHIYDEDVPGVAPARGLEGIRSVDELDRRR